ncbi:hypothetical protein Bbelb_225310 [Branchiostoma belcheri]|nr:hypothetical protein Bbelb_225310 [Branchiostoma belcheri]
MQVSAGAMQVFAGAMQVLIVHPDFPHTVAKIRGVHSGGKLGYRPSRSGCEGWDGELAAGRRGEVIQDRHEWSLLFGTSGSVRATCGGNYRQYWREDSRFITVDRPVERAWRGQPLVTPASHPPYGQRAGKQQDGTRGQKALISRRFVESMSEWGARFLIGTLLTAAAPLIGRCIWEGN